ncbi:Nitrogen fixation regulatory protein [Thermoflexales bacterium]|nr:Nitrogen fixation regulatory protein [Thermoflexales bacterium]
MSKRNRHLKQRLDELFSPPATPAETPTEAPAVPPEVPPTRAARAIGPAAAATTDLPYLRAMIDQLPLPAYLKDREHTWVAVNAAFAQLIGQTSEALIGHTDKEQADDAWQLDDRVLESGLPDTAQETNPLPDGTLCTRHVRRAPLFTGKQEVYYVLGTVEETRTPAPGADVHLPETNETYHAALDAMPGPVIISRSADDVILYANQAFSAFTGVPLEELIGRRNIQFFADVNDRDLVAQEVQQHGELHGFEVRLRRANGSILWVSLSVRRLKFKAEACVITTLEDISARKQAEEELIKFKLGIDRAYYSTMITAIDGTILYVNPAFTKIYGYTAAEAVGQKPSLLKSGQVTPEQYTRFWTRLLAGDIVTGEIINKTKDGRLIPVETNNSPILDENGRIIGFVSMQSDISARKQAEEDLLTRNKQLATFNRVGQELAQLVTVQEVVEHVFRAVGEVFDNRNLYIALYDERKQEISFPVYTIDGERRSVASRPFGNGMTEYVLRTKKALLIPHQVQDFATSIGIANIGRPSQCYLGVPLLSGEKALGIIAVQDYDHEEVYSSADVELLSAFAAQAAATLENVRLYAVETRRALQLQTTAEISTAASTVLSVDELLPFVVNLIQQRFNLYYVGLFLIDDERRQANLRAGTGEVGRLMLERQYQLPLDDRSMIGWCVQHQVPRVALDVGEDAVRFNNPDLPDTRSELALPLVSRGQVLGAMTVQSVAAAAFSEQDIAILQTMSDQVATAIANAQLFEQASQARKQAETRLRETQFLRSVGQAVSSSLDLASVTDVVMGTLQYELGFTHIALALLDKQANTVAILRASGSAAELQGLTRPIAQLENDILLDILRKGQIEVIDGWDDRLDREIYESQGHAALVRAFVPLRLRGEAIGVLEVGYRRAERARITPEEVRLLSGLTDQIAIAVGNARLFNESQQRVTELAVVNEISRTLTVTQDVQHLFATIHQQVGRLFDASNFYIATYDGGEEWSLDYQIERSQLLPGARHKLGSGFTSYILLTRQSILIRSLQENLAFHEQQKLPKIGETAKSWMGVPLIVGGSIIGVMGIQSYEQEGLYNEQNVALFSTIGTQAATAIQNARLYQEASLRANELAALNELSQELASQLSMDQVLEKVWQGVSRLLDTTNFYIALYDPEREEVSFPINASESMLDKEIEVMPASQGLTGYIIRTRQALLIKENVDQRVTELGLENVGGSSQSYLGVPLILGNQVLGVVAIQSYDQARLYNARDQELMTAIAGQAAIALQNARLFEQTQKQARETTAINDILQAVSQRKDLNQILEIAYQHIHQLVPSDACIIAMYEAQLNRLWYPLIYDNGQRYPVREGDITASTNISQVITGGVPVLIHRSVQEVQHIGGSSTAALGNLDRPSASLLYVPLNSEQKVIGALSVQSYQFNAYSPAHIDLLTRIANQLGVAVQNIRLFTQTQQALAETEQLYSASQRLATIAQLDDAMQIVAESVPVADVNRVVLWLFERDEQGAISEAIISAKWYSGQGTPPLPVGTRFSTQVLRALPWAFSQEPLFSNDLRDDPRLDEVSRTLLQQQQIAAIAILPLWTGGRQLGALLLEAERPHTFVDAEIRPYLSLSQQVATAVDNQQLLERTQRNSRQLAALNELGQVVSQQTEIEQILEFTYLRLLQLVPVDAFFAILYDRATDTISFPIIYDEGRRYIEPPIPFNPESLTGKVILSGESLLKLLTTDELAATTEIKGALGNVSKPSASLVYVPLKIGAQAMGILSVQSYQINAYNADTVQLVGNVANQVAIAIQNARLFNEAQARARREQTLREITSHVRGSTDPEVIVHTAIRELGTALGRQTFIRLGDAGQLGQPPQAREAAPASGPGQPDGLEGVQ